MDSITALPALAALAQESRLAIFRWLVELGPAGACPADIAERLGITPTTLSFHLKALQQAGLITSGKTGRSIVYRADFTAMRSLVDFLTLNCCGGDPSKCAPTASQIAQSPPKSA